MALFHSNAFGKIDKIVDVSYASEHYFLRLHLNAGLSPPEIHDPFFSRTPEEWLQGTEVRIPNPFGEGGHDRRNRQPTESPFGWRGDNRQMCLR